MAVSNASTPAWVPTRRQSRLLNRSDSMVTLNKYFDEGDAYSASNRWCIEVAWEVCNQVGGIYTVIRSKTSVSVKEMGDQYVLIGPYIDHKARQEMEESDFVSDSVLGQAVEMCRKRGYSIHTGRWLVDGYPQVILFDIGSACSKLNEWKHELYEKGGIGIPNNDIEVNDVCVFGFMVAHFLSDLKTSSSSSMMRRPNHREQSIESNQTTENDADSNVPRVESRVIAQFHEWMSGIGLVMTRIWKTDVATIFTTHATLLGRHLCAGSTDFYNNLSNFDCDYEAGKRGFYHRYCIERAASHLAHTFTTVSEITGQEAKYLIKREPDIITPNGLNVKRALHEFQNLHAESKERIHEFVRGHFYGHFDFDLDKTLYIFTAGRYEFGNKGADIFIESLAHLNYLLKRSESDKTVIAFLIFPTKTNSFNVDSLRGHAVTKGLRDTIDTVQKKMGQRLYESCLRGHIPDPADLLSQDDIVRLKRSVFAQGSSNLPPITTHNIENDNADPVIQAVRRCQLFNTTSDRVKVIFHPEFLKATNPLFGMEYQEFVRGCHLGVFPSYYEPWGYTPAECTVMGIPSVTTNLSGFGCFMQQQIVDPQSYGIYIVDRRNVSIQESIHQLANYMFDFTHLNRRQRIIQRNRTERLSDLLDWKSLGFYYHKARYMALHKVYPDDDRYINPNEYTDDEENQNRHNNNRNGGEPSFISRCSSVSSFYPKFSYGQPTESDTQTESCTSPITKNGFSIKSDDQSSVGLRDSEVENDDDEDDNDDQSHDSEEEESELKEALIMSKLSLANC